MYKLNGYATETVIAMTNYVERTFGINSLHGRVMKGNVASIKVMEKQNIYISKMCLVQKMTHTEKGC